MLPNKLPIKLSRFIILLFIAFSFIVPSKINAIIIPPHISEPSNPPIPSITGSQRITISSIDASTIRLRVVLGLTTGTSECYVLKDETLPASPPSSYQFFWDSTSIVDSIEPNNYILKVWALIGTIWMPADNTVQIKTANGLSGPACGNPFLPTVNILANGSDNPAAINSGDSVNITWTSFNALYCNVSPTGWTGKTGAKSETLTESRTYTINCTGGNQQVTNDSVTVTVTSSSPPTSTPPPETSPPSGSSSPPSTTAGTSEKQTTSGETIISPETVTSETLASADKLIIEEDIPVSITEFDPDIFLKGNNIKLNTIKNIKKNNRNFIYFEGKTRPNTLVTLYIFSNPIIVTLKSDSKGNWNYEREKRIETGKHSAFATIYDEGVTRRSDVTNFFIAKNSSGNLVLKQTAFDNLLFYGMIIGVVITFSIIILIMYRIYISKKVKNT